MNKWILYSRHKILQLVKLNPQMSEIAIEQRMNNFFRRFVRDYVRDD